MSAPRIPLAVLQRVPIPADVQRMWSRMPIVECRGKCRKSCGPWAATRAEVELIEKAIGGSIPKPTDTTCPLLTDEGKCSVYRLRPGICRLWGGSTSMECSHGCKVINFIDDPREGVSIIRPEGTDPASPWEGWTTCVECGTRLDQNRPEPWSTHCKTCLHDTALRIAAGENIFLQKAVYDEHQYNLGAYRHLE